MGVLPDGRYGYYAKPNFNSIKADVLTYFNQMTTDLGYFNVAGNPDVLSYLEPYSYAVLFIGLIFDILLIIFIVVSVLLIYSLLLISVETKTFEIGVMRLVGLTKAGFIGMILTQAGMFVLPAVLLAFACSFPVLYFIFDAFLGDSIDYRPSIVPSWKGIGMAVFVGVLIPLLSSIIPIRRALSENLTDALNVNRSKNKGVLVTFIDKKTKDVLPFLLFGSVAVVFGFAIYYGFPVALL